MVRVECGTPTGGPLVTSVSYLKLQTEAFLVNYKEDTALPGPSVDALQLLGEKGLQPFYSPPKWLTPRPLDQSSMSSPISSNPQQQERTLRRTSLSPDPAPERTWREEMAFAFFNFEANKSDMPFAELELSYHLYLPPGWYGDDFYHQQKLCVEIGRFFKQMLSLNDEYRATGRHVSWSTIHDYSQKCTLRRLLQRCTPRSRSLLSDEPKTNKEFLWLKIYRVLCDTNHVSILDQEAANFHHPISLDVPIFDVLETAYLIPRDFYSTKPTTPYTSHKHFTPGDFSFQRLTKQGGLRLEWTRFYREHLQVDESRQTLSVFWDIGVIEQSGLLWHAPHDHDAFNLGLS
jgi:hypothetical protein